MPSTNDFSGLLEWRCIGPFRGGRVVTVAGDYQNPNVFYFGACAGGVWKTSDGGHYWECVSDGFFKTAAVGALAVAPSDSHVIYAGTGETTIRIDVSHGDGVYKSTDAGRSWTHIGLSDTRFIGKIRVHPNDPDTVLVAALGHAFGPNKERGVFKSTDGGQNWKQVLFKSEKAGAVDLTLDANPRIAYAAIWEAHRNFWQISSGGPESGIWQSTDGGDHWVDISDRPGLPKGIKGKIGLAASPVQSGRVWALIEHQPQGGLYRSDDAGATWEKVSDNQNLLSRAWYYTHITADPVDPETVYVNNLSFYKSNDGGKTFFTIDTPHGDNHDVWIDPRNNQRLIQGNDGGANVSYNGGASWSSIYNQPTAQFYHIAADTRDPYVVYGTQQDNSSIAVPNRVNHTGIAWADSYIAGTGESGYIVPRPDDPNIVYVGAIGSSPGGGNALQRYDHRTRQIRLITTWPETMSGRGAGEQRYRFAWTYPIIISPHDVNTLYIGGNIVFKSTNEGQSWQPISPDLTKADPETLKPTGGPINRDSVGAEVFATVFSLIESPHEAGVLWAGSDDGLLHISKDAGANWKNVTPPDLGEWTMITCIEPSPTEKGSVYVVGTRYKNDDYKPYIWKTSDYGKTWKKIVKGIDKDAYTRVLRADPSRAGLLFAGTETGLYVSFDDGANWEKFQLNLPITPLHDLLIKGSDLIAGTHGRSIWVLDDITPLRQFSKDVASAKAHLFPPRPSVRIMPGVDWTGNNPGKNYLSMSGGAFTFTTDDDGRIIRKFLDVGQNPPRGVIITYALKNQPKQPITLTFSDAQGNLLRSFTSRDLSSTEKPKEQKAPAAAGWNRFVWDMRHTPVTKIEGKDPIAEATVDGPLVPPGMYQVALKVGDTTLTEQFEVTKPSTIQASQEDLQAQYDLLVRIYTKLNETVAGVNRARDLRAQLDGWATRSEQLSDGKAIGEVAKALKEKVLEIEKELQVPDLRAGWADNFNNGVRLLAQLSSLTDLVELGDYRPTDQAEEFFTHIVGKIDAVLGRLNAVIEAELPAINAGIAAAQVGAILPKK
ncbi:MAG: glycosyl hydrolase [Roseiflexaceae bacterium]|nr:glycosyl hydrolase [Roseiflexaceae bacterium]